MKDNYEMDDLWFGKLPSHWAVNKIGQLYRERKTKVSDYDYPALSVTMQGILPQLEHAAKTDAHDDRKLIRKGDFVINSRSDRRGSCGISDYDGSCSLINTVLAPKTEMNPQYYNWFFHTTRFAEEFYRWGHGIVDDLWTTRYEDMKRIMIPVPPLEEQELIASYLDKKCAAIDEAIARRRQIIERLEDYRLSQISFMATKGIKNNVQMKNSGTDWFGEIPNTWSVKRFKYIAQVKSNLVEPEPYLSLDQIGPDIIEKNSGRLIGKRTVEDAGVISGNHLFHKGQILYSKVRPALNKVVVAPFDGLCSADMYPIETSMDTEYLKYLMLSKPFVEQTRIIAMIRVKMPKINQDELGDILCVVPPADEQKEIASKINAMCSRVESMIAKNDEIINKLEEYRKSIIYNAVTGKIDCREAV